MDNNSNDDGSSDGCDFLYKIQDIYSRYRNTVGATSSRNTVAKTAQEHGLRGNTKSSLLCPVRGINI